MTSDQIATGAHGRPLWNERDRQAEAIRVVLRQAGCQEWIGGDELDDNDDGQVGFVVESENPFLVCCPDDDELDRHAEERRYATALTAAGYRVEPDEDDDGLQVWPPAS